MKHLIWKFYAWDDNQVQYGTTLYNSFGNRYFLITSEKKFLKVPFVNIWIGLK